MSMNMHKHKRNVCGQSSTSALSRTLSRVILWWHGEHVEKELYDTLNEVDTQRELLQMELDALKAMLAEVHHRPWKVTKDGKRRYRKVAHKILVNSWTTESEPIPDIDHSALGEVPLRRIQLFQSSFQDLTDGYYD